ncbi:MAG: hypothetical protein IKJ94_01165 [Oscillospiraceae bacterium]|nr:hypothetical protein [Oscillospiraceae bacterium]
MDRLTFDNQLDEILSEAEALIPNKNLPDLPFMPEAPDVHDYYRFELDLWDKGEEIRQFILAAKKKPNIDQITRICDICTNPFAKRGRQSFVMLLGKKCYAEYAPIISPFLSDDDIDGHVVDTLYKMGTPDYVAQIQPFTKHKRTWIRNIAKKYVNKYS